MIQRPFSRTLPGEDLRPGFVLQDRTIICWLNVAGDLVPAKKRKIALAGLYALVLATPHAFTLRSLAIVSHAVRFLDSNHI